MAPVYTVVTSGCPAPNRDVPPVRWTRNLERAKARADACKGTGTCMEARVLEVPSPGAARTADISRLREGERTVYFA